MSTSRGAWSVAGLVAGFAGLAASYCVAMVTTIRDAPVVAVAELVIRLTPGPVVERAIQILGHRDKPVLMLGVLVLCGVLFAWAGRLARRTWWAPTIVFGALAVFGGIAVWSQRGFTTLDLLPVAVGFATWLICLSLLTEPLRRHELAVEAAPAELEVADPAHPDHTRRTFLIRAGTMVAAGVALGVVGRAVGRGRRHVEETRRLLRLPGVTPPQVPKGVRVDVPGMSAVGDADRRLLPDRHRVRRTRDRARRLGAAHPRHGRPRDRAQLPAADRPLDDRGLGDPQLRLERGRRRPDRQRLVERGADRRPARRGRRAAGRGRRAADLRRRLDLRHPARRR